MESDKKVVVIQLMCTGDHLNIAKETAKLIGMSTNILPNTELWPASAMRDEMIEMEVVSPRSCPRTSKKLLLCCRTGGRL